MVGVQLVSDKREHDFRGVVLCLFQGISFALSHVQTGPEFPMPLKAIDPELLILLPLSLKCWGYKPEPPHPVSVLLGTRVLCMPGKHSIELHLQPPRSASMIGSK